MIAGSSRRRFSTCVLTRMRVRRNISLVNDHCGAFGRAGWNLHFPRLADSRYRWWHVKTSQWRCYVGGPPTLSTSLVRGSARRWLSSLFIGEDRNFPMWFFRSQVVFLTMPLYGTLKENTNVKTNESFFIIFYRRVLESFIRSAAGVYYLIMIIIFL